jgi:hypothetical protein
MNQLINNLKSIKNQSFEAYINDTLNEEFTDLDLGEELKKFQLYWAEGSRKLKRPKLAFRNWLINARKYKTEKYNGRYQVNPNPHGQTFRDTRKNETTKYTRGKYGYSTR